MNNNYVEVNPAFFTETIWTEATPEQKGVLMTLLMSVQSEETQWEWKEEKMILQPGQLLTTLPSLAEQCGKWFTTAKIESVLKRLALDGFLTDEPIGNFRLITIKNWGIHFV